MKMAIRGSGKPADPPAQGGTAPGDYEAARERAVANPEAFWGELARTLHWFTPYSTVRDARGPPTGQWFVGGRVNACFEAIDRHVLAGRGEAIALVHDSAYTGVVTRFTYRELQRRVAELAGALRHLGVGPGHRVLVYMPLIPEGVIAMLACARIGAVHSVVFGGFGARELAVRIEHAKPRVILAASCGLEPNRVVPYKPIIDEALALARHRPDACLILQRPQCIADLRPGRDHDWTRAVTGAAAAECVPVEANHPLYILYTSGTTGAPKGVVRDTAGYLVALRYSMRAVYDVREDDVYWSASDIGWVVGHSYIVYGPLIAGCTTVLYEGKPVGTPDAGAFWRVVETHRVNVLFTAPTALRAIKRDDPRCMHLETRDTSSLRALFLAGERADADTVTWAQHHLRKPVIDHWWQTETGWPIAANCLGLGAFPVKPGSPTRPVPGFAVHILDEEGRPLPHGESGAIALKLPLPPGCLTGLWEDEDGFRHAYLERYPGYYNSGDGGYFDDDGYLYVMGRLDDVINVAGHRLSTGEIEEVLASHAAVAECAVIPVSDPIKGQVPAALVVLKSGTTATLDDIEQELIALVRHQVGPVASFRLCRVVARLPKTRSGKVLRGTMRKMAAAQPWTTPATIEDPASLEELAPILAGFVGQQIAPGAAS